VRLRLTITLDVKRAQKPQPVEEPHETFESNGSLADFGPVPRYVGFVPEE